MLTESQQDNPFNGWACTPRLAWCAVLTREKQALAGLFDSDVVSEGNFGLAWHWAYWARMPGFQHCTKILFTSDIVPDAKVSMPCQSEVP